MFIFLLSVALFISHCFLRGANIFISNTLPSARTTVCKILCVAHESKYNIFFFFYFQTHIHALCSSHIHHLGRTKKNQYIKFKQCLFSHIFLVYSCSSSCYRYCSLFFCYRLNLFIFVCVTLFFRMFKCLYMDKCVKFFSFRLMIYGDVRMYQVFYFYFFYCCCYCCFCLPVQF